MHRPRTFTVPGTALAASLVAVVGLLAGPPSEAHAAVSAVTPSAPLQAVRLTETWNISYTESGTVPITSAAVTFPDGFTIPQGVIAGARAVGAATCTGVTATGTGQVVSFTMDPCATVAADTNKFVIPGVVNPMIPGVTGGFKVVTSADAFGATGTATIGIRGFLGDTIAAKGLTLVSFTGTTALLNVTAATHTPKVVTVSVTVDGNVITYVIGAPAFVNANFHAAFQRDFDATYVIVKAAD